MIRRRPELRVAWLGAWFAALCALGAPAAASARDLWASEDYEHLLALESALKFSWLSTRLPDDPILFQDRTSQTQLWRLRFSLSGNVGEHFNARVSYEHRAQYVSTQGGLGRAGILPSVARAPFRLTQVDYAIVDQPEFVHRHELDRAYLALHFGKLDLTIGRQAIGLGRGTLFSAVDIFAPFSPLEVDREWRRGVDAVRAELGLTDTFSADVVVAADLGDLDERRRAGVDPRPIDSMALVGRLRGYLGEVDGELLAGRRARDWLVAVVGSTLLGDAELHAESAWFATDGAGVRGLGDSDWVAKAIVGGSYQFDVGEGLRVMAEYHYSGFGLEDVAGGFPAFGRDPSLGLLPAEVLAGVGIPQGLAVDPAFQQRLARADTQTLGRHTVSAVVSYDLSAATSGSLTGLASPKDGSGLVALGVTWVQSDNVTLVASGFVPWGKRPRRGELVGPAGSVAYSELRSEYGASGYSGFLQLRVYD